MNYIIKLFGIIVYLNFSISYLICTVKDPGIPSKDYYLENYDIEKMNIKNYKICSKCRIIMDLDQNTEHCYDCDICIINNDHHCPWTSKCVGKSNIISFYYFITALFIHIFYCTFALISMSATIQNKKNK